MAKLAKQSKIIIPIIKMVPIFMMHFKIAMATTFLAKNISSFYKSLQGMGIGIVKFILFPVRVIPTNEMFLLVVCLTRFRAEGAVDRRIVANCLPTLSANAYGGWFMLFVERSLCSHHNETIAHTTNKVKL